jgi:hypothetical protein
VSRRAKGQLRLIRKLDEAITRAYGLILRHEDELFRLRDAMRQLDNMRSELTKDKTAQPDQAKLESLLTIVSYGDWRQR